MPRRRSRAVTGAAPVRAGLLGWIGFAGVVVNSPQVDHQRSGRLAGVFPPGGNRLETPDHLRLVDARPVA